MDNYEVSERRLPPYVDILGSTSTTVNSASLRGGGIDTLIYETSSPTWYFSDSNAYYAVRMEPEYPCSVLAIQFYAYHPWASGVTYDIYMWSDDGTGLPSSVVYGPQVYTFTVPGWVHVPIDTVQFSSGIFHLGYYTNGPDWGGGANVSDNGPSSGHSNINPFGYGWLAVDTWNWCIRAVVQYTSAVGEIVDKMPNVFALSQNHPNPMVNKTSIRYALAKSCDVVLTLYDVTGRQVALLLEEQQEPGFYQVVIDDAVIADELLSNGIYFYRIEADDFVQTKKMIICR
jgi:hypothetical protein